MTRSASLPPPRPRTVFLVDGDPAVAGAHALLLVARGHRVLARTRYAEARLIVKARVHFDVAVVELELGTDFQGLALGRQLLSRRLVKKLVFCSATENLRHALAALRLGDLVQKSTPTTAEALVAAVERDPEDVP